MACIQNGTAVFVSGFLFCMYLSRIYCHAMQVWCLRLHKQNKNNFIKIFITSSEYRQSGLDRWTVYSIFQNFLKINSRWKYKTKIDFCLHKYMEFGKLQGLDVKYAHMVSQPLDTCMYMYNIYLSFSRINNHTLWTLNWFQNKFYIPTYF